MAADQAPTAHPRGPVSRAERQEQTREALVHAARAVFARDGYHGARLDQIARAAGYSKGAVYSNFDGKAALFLAVIDANLAAIGDEPWDPFDHVPPAPPVDSPQAADEAELSAAMGGFALATLEFIASAARSPDLRDALAERIRSTIHLYSGVVATRRALDDPLTVDQLATLVAGLDQGVAMLGLSGVATVDQEVLRSAMKRLIAGRVDDSPGPDGSADGAGPHDGGSGGRAALHDAEIRRRIGESLRR